MSAVWAAVVTNDNLEAVQAQLTRALGREAEVVVLHGSTVALNPAHSSPHSFLIRLSRICLGNAGKCDIRIGCERVPVIPSSRSP